jgi:adenosine kinase
VGFAIIKPVTKSVPLIISGSIAIDRIMSFDGKYSDHIRPEKLDSLSISIFLKALHDSRGGVGANIAYTLALLGATPHLLGSVGPDASDYIGQLASIGVKTDHIHKSDLATASFNVITDGDENQVGGFYPGAMFDSETLSLEPWRTLDPIVVVSPHDPTAMRRQVSQCLKWGLKLVYDVGQQVSNLSPEDILAGINAAYFLIVNDYEMEALAAKIGQSVESIKIRVPIVVTTLGSNGSTIEGAAVRSAIKVASVPARQVVDPTGAGDAYRAGLLFGLSHGWDLKTAAQLGATTGVYAVEHTGTQEHRFTLSEVAARYKEAFGEEMPQLTDTNKETVHAKNRI